MLKQTHTQRTASLAPRKEQPFPYLLFVVITIALFGLNDPENTPEVVNDENSESSGELLWRGGIFYMIVGLRDWGLVFLNLFPTASVPNKSKFKTRHYFTQWHTSLSSYLFSCFLNYLCSVRNWSFCCILDPSVYGQIILLSTFYEHRTWVNSCQHTLDLYCSFSLLFFLDRKTLSSLEFLSIMQSYLQTTWYTTRICISWQSSVNDGWRSGVISDSSGCVSCLQCCWPWTDPHSGSLEARTNGMSCGAQSYVQLWALKHVGNGLSQASLLC